jgi:hypothetical protein
VARTGMGLAVLGLAAAFGLAGCGKTDTPLPAKVSGVVTFQGRPLSGGLVVFVPDPDRTATGTLHTANLSADGRFELAGGAASVPPGWYRVAIGEPAGWYETGFPPPLRRPDRSGLEREVKPGHDHHFEFHVETGR